MDFELFRLFLYNWKMKKIYYLQTCDTCKRIIKSFDFSTYAQQNIKTEAITESQLEEMKALAGSYEALFSKRARNYHALGLKDQNLTEERMKEYLLSDYTFLKRPVIIDGTSIFIGSDKKNLAAFEKHTEHLWLQNEISY